MNLHFFKSPYGHGTRITYARKQWDPNRDDEDYPWVNFEGVVKLAHRFQVPQGRKFAELIVRLNKAAETYSWAGIGVEPTDSAIAKWIEKKATLTSISIISKSPTLSPQLFTEAAKYAGKALNKANEVDLMADPVKAGNRLRGLGFDIQQVGDHFALGGSKFIENWFAAAPYVLKAMTAAREVLLERNYGTDKIQASIKAYHPDDTATGKSKLYGRDLPKLYERITGKVFDGKRIDGELECRECHRFVMRAAKAIGCDVISAITIQDYFDKQRATEFALKRGRPKNK